MLITGFTLHPPSTCAGGWTIGCLAGSSRGGGGERKGRRGVERGSSWPPVEDGQGVQGGEGAEGGQEGEAGLRCGNMHTT